jgi:hypothetical protein
MARITCPVLDGAHAKLQQQPLMPEDLVLKQDLLDDLRRAAHEVGAAQSAPRLQLLARGRRPAALPPDLVHHHCRRRVVGVHRRLRVVGNEAMRVDAERELRRVVAGLARRLPVELGKGCKAFGHPADDRQRQRQPQRRRTHHRLRRAAHRHPDRDRLLHRARIDALVVQRGAVFARPGDGLGLHAA